MLHDFSKLLAVLNNELLKQEDLLNVLWRERAAILHVKHSEIEKVACEKEKLLSELDELVKTRNDVSMRLVNKLKDDTEANKTEEGIKLDTLITKCNQSSIQYQLIECRKEIRRTATTIGELNDFNGKLIRKTLGLITSTVAILSGGCYTPTYSQSGNLEDKTSTRCEQNSINKEV